MIAGLAGGGVVRRKPDGFPSVDRKRATADASRRLATGRAERNHADPSRGSRPTVEPECGAVGASRKFRAGAARGGSGSESCRFAAGGAGGRDSRLYYATIKIETPEASVSGVFNLCVVFSRLRPSTLLPTGSRTTLVIENPPCHPVSYEEQRKSLPPWRCFVWRSNGSRPQPNGQRRSPLARSSFPRHSSSSLMNSIACCIRKALKSRSYCRWAHG